MVGHALSQFPKQQIVAGRLTFVPCQPARITGPASTTALTALKNNTNPRPGGDFPANPVNKLVVRGSGWVFAAVGSSHECVVRENSSRPRLAGSLVPGSPLRAQNTSAQL